MGKQYCPSCGSHDVELDDEGGMVCLDCGRHADNFPEEHMLIEDEMDDEETSPIKKKPAALADDDEPVEKAKASKKAKPKAKKAKAKKPAKKGRKK